jgi:hypothetical protein
VVVNQEKDTLATFSSNKLGIGSFELIPELKADYQAMIMDSEGSTSTFAFPEVLESGISMRFEAGKSSYTAKVESNGEFEAPERLFISGLSRNKFIYFDSRFSNGSSTNFTIPFDSLNEGINQFTLFDNQGIPICERKVFHYPETKLNIGLNINNVNPTLRESVEISLKTTEQGGSQIPADLSVSIYNTDSMLNGGMMEFEYYLWLLSELKGHVENPGYYFETKNSQLIKEMDDLMLSQGWSKYNIHDIIESEAKEIKFLPEFIDQVLTARVSKGDTREPVSNQEVTLSFVNSYTQLFSDWSDYTGRLSFETWNVFGIKDMIINYQPEEGQHLQISIDPQFSGLVNVSDQQPFSLPPTLENFLIDQSINMQVENIFDQQVETIIIPDTTSFYGIPDASYLLDDYTRFPVMEEVMREYVYGVNVRRENGKFVFKVLDIPQNEIMNKSPLVLLDGVPVHDIDKIMNIDPLNIRKIDVVHSRYYYGSLECSGIVAFYSYQSDLPEFTLNKNSIRQRFIGFQLEKSFYSPKYDAPESIQNRIPDFRNQLLWDPQIHTDEKGLAKINFYTSDKSGTYRIVVHGLSSNGLAGSYFGTLNVMSE